MSAALAVINEQRQQWESLIGLVLDGLTSPHSKRAYRAALTEFLAFYYREPRSGFNKAAVQAFRSELESNRLSPSSINIRLQRLPTCSMP